MVLLLLPPATQLWARKGEDRKKLCPQIIRMNQNMEMWGGGRSHHSAQGFHEPKFSEAKETPTERGTLQIQSPLGF